ncbi:GspH/FimT family pseudopilin [Pseudomonadota bacterium]
MLSVTEVTEKQLVKRDDFEMMEKICIGKSPQRRADSRQACARQAASASGFTLLEIMIVIVILGVGLSLAIPNMRDGIRSYELTSRASYWLNLLNHARSEAAKRGSRVTLCASSNGTSCATTLQSNLHQGWILWADTDGDGVRDGVETIIRTGAVVNDFTYVQSGTYISFISNGMTTTIGNARWSGTIGICRPDSTTGRQVIINVVGRVRIANWSGCP